MFEINLHIDELLALPCNCWRKMTLMKRNFERAETNGDDYGRGQTEGMAGDALRDIGTHYNGF